MIHFTLQRNEMILKQTNSFQVLFVKNGVNELSNEFR